MMIKPDFRFLVAVSLAAVVAGGVLLVADAQGFVGSNNCVAPVENAKFERPLSRTARLLGGDKPLSIVAFGSSSTAGAGATSPSHSYPSRLEAEMKERFPLRSITVRNRGVGGTEMVEMIA